MTIDNNYNYDDQFFRMVGVSLTKTLSRSIRWINRFQDKKIRVIVPFYLSLSGDERFVLDAFVDDVAGKRVELNTDQIPRGIVSLTNISTNGDEFANPNQFLAKEVKIDEQYRKIISKVKAIPISINYDINIVVDTELDSYRVIEKILKVLFNYYFFNIDYFGLKIDAVLSVPDEKTIDLLREQNLESETKKHITFPLTIKTYYPDFFIDTDDYETCDNDDEIDWKSYGLIPPSEMGSVPSEKKVYWNNYVFNKDKTPNPDDELRTNTKKETF